MQQQCTQWRRFGWPRGMHVHWSGRRNCDSLQLPAENRIPNEYSGRGRRLHPYNGVVFLDQDQRLICCWVWAVAGVALLLTGACGCSSFDRHWEAAASRIALADHLEGRWVGTWSSDVNGHSGGLRCVVTKMDGKIYRAAYRATFAKILTARYTVVLHGRNQEGRTYVEGSHDLGWLAGGLYHYQGSSDGERFVSTYHSKSDYGQFDMARPQTRVEELRSRKDSR